MMLTSCTIIHSLAHDGHHYMHMYTGEVLRGDRIVNTPYVVTKYCSVILIVLLVTKVPYPLRGY